MNFSIFYFQGGHIKIIFNSLLPVQVDGEPWVASPGYVVVLKSALKVSIRHITRTNHIMFTVL